jgi:hypothetical protein
MSVRKKGTYAVAVEGVVANNGLSIRADDGCLGGMALVLRRVHLTALDLLVPASL